MLCVAPGLCKSNGNFETCFDFGFLSVIFSRIGVGKGGGVGVGGIVPTLYYLAYNISTSLPFYLQHGFGHCMAVTCMPSHATLVASYPESIVKCKFLFWLQSQLLPPTVNCLATITSTNPLTTINPKQYDV